MVRAEARWALRDWLAAAILFAATAGVVLCQNAHVAVLWDLSYVLDTATRIALGQAPYRDFPLAHSPLTFLIQAAIIRLCGRAFLHHVLYAAIVGGLSTVLTWRIALCILRSRVSAAWPIALALAAPLTVLGVYCILPLPSYDCDCAFVMLVAIRLLLRVTPNSADAPEPSLAKPSKHPLSRAFVAGSALSIPLFFKQNIGLPFLAAASAVILLVLAAHWIHRASPGSPQPRTATLLFVLAGAATTLLAATLLIQVTVGLGNYIHWTIQFAAQRRLPGLRQMLTVYNDPQLLWTLPGIIVALILLERGVILRRRSQIFAIGLLAAPFIYTLCTLFIYEDADERGDSLLALWPMLLILAGALAFRNLRSLRLGQTLEPLLPIVLLAAIHGALMSQQLWGSTYAIWSLLILLVAEMIAYLAELRLPRAKPNAAERSPAPLMAGVFAATLLVCGAFYTASEERLSYAQVLDGPVQHSAFPQLQGMSTPGPYLPNLDQLLRYSAAHIPQNDGIILIPGEDPFYFVTGRVPRFPVLLFDPATDPYSPAQLAEEARSHNIRWLVVKHDLQIKEDPTPQRESVLRALFEDFTPSAQLRSYDVYHRR